MELELRRIARKETYTIGKLSIDGEDFCDTVEDKDRGLSQEMPEHKIKEIKVYGQTAIPTGRYKVDMDTVSLRFKERSWAKPYDGKLPRLIGVPGFEGVLIHPLNTAQESSGCIGPGINSIVGRVMNSTATFHSLMKRLLAAKDDIYISIK